MAALALLMALPAAAEKAAAVEVKSRQVPLAEEGLRANGAGRLRFLGGLALSADDARFGGMSSLDVTPDGTGFAAVTDQGNLVTARIAYDRAGRLARVTGLEIAPLLGETGKPLPGKAGDAEAKTRLADGAWAVSFERDHRVMRYPTLLPPSPSTQMDAPAGLSELPGNEGIEAMATLPDGRLILMAEAVGPDGLHPVWIGGGQTWTEHRYRGVAPYQPVDVAVMPDGGLLVLERRYDPINGVGVRLALVPASVLAEGGVIAGKEIARMNPPLTVDNFEGVDVRRLPGGQTLVYLLSDNNFNPLQRNLLFLFELETGAGGR